MFLRNTQEAIKAITGDKPVGQKPNYVQLALNDEIVIEMHDIIGMLLADIGLKMNYMT